MPRPYDSNASRREFLRYLALTAGSVYGLGAIACADKNKVRSVALNLWGTGTLDIGDGWRQLASDKGINLTFQDNNNDPGPIIVQLEAGEAKQRHVSGLQGGAETELAAKKLAIPWDLVRIPNYDQLWPWAKDIGYTKVGQDVYGIPSVINADSMIYLPEFTGPVDSYSAVFDPRLRGKTSMEDAWINSVIFTAIYLKGSKQAQIANTGNLTLSELDTVMTFLRGKAKDRQFLKLWAGWQDGVDMIVRKRVHVMTGWEPIVFEARRQGVNAAYAVPREGYEGWSNDLILHPGARNDAAVYEAAHQLIDWELGGFYGAELAARRGYVVPTDAGMKYAELRPQNYDVPALHSTFEGVKKKFFDMQGKMNWQNVRPEEHETYREQWDRFKAMIR